LVGRTSSRRTSGSHGVPDLDPLVSAGVRAVPGELLSDREVADPADDRLGHQQLGQQLANLALSVPDPSNIALYGPWGSGKTGIGNLVERLLTRRNDVAFARFDAFKYAENPLRRNFVSAVATALDVKESRYREDLYSGRTTTDIAVPPTRLVRLVGTFAVLAAAICFGLFVVVAAIAVIQSGDFAQNFRSMSRQVASAALAPAALLAAFIALAGKSLVTERKSERADSDEQFESLFTDLVSSVKKHRVVVFVDELDRCSPADVVATLDAVRTFLGVRGCVFIVAADRQVLEQALTTHAQQATPLDPVNPYYSAGSAYLDKVFQYQVLVPPLLQHSVTRFAAELVRGRSGVWSDLGGDLDLIVSILVPSHVRSPRRVKSLLNSFALAYRLAEARAAAGLLATDVTARADEIARLSCLRLEFPLFAQHLVVDARLPEYVLRLHEDSAPHVWDDYPHVPDEVKKIAEDFAELRTPVATLISDEIDRADEGGENTEDDEPIVSVEHKHGRQLLDYLTRTRTVRGPGRDLVHLRALAAWSGWTRMSQTGLSERLPTAIRGSSAAFSGASVARAKQKPF
jgi:hypothetical protein